MSAAILNCLVARFVRFIAKCYEHSVLARITGFFSRMYGLSFLKRVMDKLFLCSSGITRGSRIYGWCERFNNKLHSLHGKWRPVLDSSIPGRLYICLTGSAVISNSLVGKAVFEPGMKRVLLVVFSLFLPIDWALRDVLRISFLASIWDEVFLLGSAAYLILDLIFAVKARKPRVSPLDMPIISFLGAGLALMFIVSPFFNIAVAGYRATVQYILWFFVVLRLVQEEKDVVIVCCIFTVMTTLIALHGIYQYIVAVPIPDSWTTSTEYGIRTRVFSIFGSPNIMGDFMALMAPITASLAYYFKDYRLKVVMWGCVVLMCFACLFTLSRGAWFALAIAVFIFGLINDKKILVLCAFAILIALNIPAVSSRIDFLFTDDFKFASQSGGRAGRKALALLYLTFFSNPWFGFGLGMFGGAVAMQYKPYLWISYCYVDNYYLKIMTEMGYIGISVFVLTLVCMLYNCLRSITRCKKRKEPLGYIAGGMFSGLCGVLVHCYFENIFEEPYMMAYFWGIVALIIFIGFFNNGKASEERELV